MTAWGSVKNQTLTRESIDTAQHKLHSTARELCHSSSHSCPGSRVYKYSELLLLFKCFPLDRQLNLLQNPWSQADLHQLWRSLRGHSNLLPVQASSFVCHCGSRDLMRLPVPAFRLHTSTSTLSHLILEGFVPLFPPITCIHASSTNQYK